MKELSQTELLPAANARYVNICLLVSESDGTGRLVTRLEERSSQSDGEPVSPSSDLLWLNFPNII